MSALARLSIAAALVFAGSLSAHAAPARGADPLLCGLAGGQFESLSSSCVCQPFGVSVDPAKDSCATKIGAQLDRGLLRRGPLAGPLPTEVERYCRREAGSALDAAIRLRLKLEALKPAAPAAVYQLLYTPERKAKARDLFERARTLALEILSAKAAPGSEHLAPLQASLAQARLAMEPADFEAQPAELLQFNAHTFADRTIFIDGLILLADQNPDALFQVIAHEMGHVVGPTYLFLKSLKFNRAPVFPKYDGSYPFDDGLRCVARKVTQPDLGCLYEQAEEMGRTAAFRDFAAGYALAADRLKENPYVSIGLFSVGKKCQIGQNEEAFADFFSSELLARSLAGGTLSAAELDRRIENSLAFFCEGTWREEFQAPALTAPYPAMAARIDQILLSNDRLRDLLGSRPTESCAL